MLKTTRLIPILLVLVVGISACNLPASNVTPTPEVNIVLTSAAQTAAANMTQGAILNPPTIPPTNTAGFATSTLAIATTSVPPTSAPPTQSCDVAQFIDDVTIPDGTTLKPNETFVKTWRLKNAGTCTWSTSYAVVYSSGDSMNGPASQALAGSVNPGQTVDISVNLTAPGSDGNYRGNWKLRNAAGVLFSQFYVDIKVKTPTSTGPVTVTLNATGGTEGGTVYEPAADVAVVNGTILGGDTASNFIARGFMSFDISSLSGKTVSSATLDLSSCTAMQDPFGGTLAGIWVSEVLYTSPLHQSDYDISGTGIQRLSALPSSSIDVKSSVQARATEGKSRFQIRLHPAGPSDADGQADYITCSATGPRLTVTYQP